MALTNTSMQAVFFSGHPYNVSVGAATLPRIANATDAVVRITRSAICGSDLHRYHGFIGTGNAPYVLGHEAIGWVSEVGEAVATLNVGDYVVIPFSTDSGHLDLYPEAGLRYGGGNPAGGLQAEFARVPFADHTLVRVPLSRSNTTAELEQDYLAISDILPTGWTALDYSDFQAGDTVAVFGAGPVGLMAILSAVLRGASKVYAVDQHLRRLALAQEMGAIPINFLESDPVQQIMRYEPEGVRRVLDCVGMESVDRNGTRDTGLVLRQAVSVAGYRGGLGIVGIYLAQNRTNVAPRAEEIPQVFDFPYAEFFRKGLTMGSGAVDPFPMMGAMRELITSIAMPNNNGIPGRISPSLITTAEIPIHRAPEYYNRFSNAGEVKIFISFP